MKEFFMLSQKLAIAALFSTFSLLPMLNLKVMVTRTQKSHQPEGGVDESTETTKYHSSFKEDGLLKLNGEHHPLVTIRALEKNNESVLLRTNIYGNNGNKLPVSSSLVTAEWNREAKISLENNNGRNGELLKIMITAEKN